MIYFIRAIKLLFLVIKEKKKDLIIVYFGWYANYYELCIFRLIYTSMNLSAYTNNIRYLYNILLVFYYDVYESLHEWVV